MKSRPPKAHGGKDLIACWIWDGNRWRPGWAKRKVTQGKNKGFWHVLSRVHCQTGLGSWRFRWVKRFVHARSIKWIE